MEGLLISFNFLKNIGQHMDSADWMIYGLRQVYMQPTPLWLCWMARSTTVLSEDINLHTKFSGTSSG